MTWNELKKMIKEMTKEQKETDVTVYDTAESEFFPVMILKFNDEGVEHSDVLDEGHPFLII